MQAETWKLEDAKARFSELVRAARSLGPQTVTVRGKASVVVLAVEDYERLSPASGELTLYQLLSSSPLADLDFETKGEPMPVREVVL